MYIKLLRQAATLTGVGLLALPSASSYAAKCEYRIQSQYTGGFTANIRITNDTATAINGWSVNWAYSDGSRRTGGWNANVTGGNPYTATGVGWNDKINPGQFIEFGVQGTKTAATAASPQVMGAVCNSTPQSSSVASSIPRSSSVPSSIPRSSSVPSSAQSSSVPSSVPRASSVASSVQSSSVPSSVQSSSVPSSVPRASSVASSVQSSSIPSSVSSSSRSSSSSSNDTRLDNPFVDARWYVDPLWSAKANTEPGGDKIAHNNTAVWMDRISAISPADGGFGLRDHLDAALAQNANVIQIVVYDLPNRDCHALSSNGELKQGAEGTTRYRTEYIDALAAIFSDEKYKSLRIIAIIEPDSLPNLVTNLSDSDCQLATDKTNGYIANTQYTLNKLSPITNVYSYMDIGHSGWLGWPENFDKAITLISNTVKGTTNGVKSISGFVSNTSGYTPTYEPFLDSLANSAFSGGGQVRQAKFYEWNPQFSEMSFIQAWRTKMIAAGFPNDIGMLIDTSRNGWGGLSRPTALSSSTNLDTFVDSSRVDHRVHRGNWCNQPGGIGERPQASPAPGVDAYVWVKPPGESDGASSKELSFDPLDPAKGFDRMCDPTYIFTEGNSTNLTTSALANAPVAGRWFPEAFQQLLNNAYPPLTADSSSSSVKSSLASSSVRTSSSSSSIVVIMPSSSAATSSVRSSNVASSEVANSSSLASSSVGNTAPIANLNITVTGTTIFADARGSSDADADNLTYTFDFGDTKSIEYSNAWHTYLAAGDYTVKLSVSDGHSTVQTSQTVTVLPAAGNQAPIAMLTAVRDNKAIVAYATASYDTDGNPLTYEWDFGKGAYSAGSRTSLLDCVTAEDGNKNYLVTLTVSDGTLKDTRQVRAGGTCGLVFDVVPRANFTSKVEGSTVYVDARETTDATRVSWSFGDGAKAVGVLASHTYTDGGAYNITLAASGPTLFSDSIIHTVNVSGGSSRSSLNASSVSSLTDNASSSVPASSSVMSSLISSSVPSSVPKTSSSVASSVMSVSSILSSSSSSSSADNNDRTICPVPPAAIQYGSWAPYDTNNASQKVVANYLDLMVKMPVFNNGVIPLPYNLHQPTQAASNPQAKYPLVIYLHGGGERGSLGEHLTSRHALPFFASSNSLLTAENQLNKPAYIVAPQCNCDFISNEWSSGGGSPFTVTGAQSKYGKALTDLIENLKTKYQIDPDRIYVTGISMGGGGAWELAARRPDLIAAAIPMAGFPVNTSAAKAVADSKVVIWAQKGDGDENNPIAQTQATVKAIADVGGCATMATFPMGSTANVDPGDPQPSADLQHTVWMRAYMNPQLWNYVFSVKRAHIAGTGSSVSTSSKASVASSSIAFSSSIISSSVASLVPSSASVASSSVIRVSSSSAASLGGRNHYNAPKATTAPVIDGVADAIWDKATWAPIDTRWLGSQAGIPSATDFSGRYKAMWDQGNLYLLFDITDDKIYDGHPSPLDSYWEDDTVELFIDENKSGGLHDGNTSAWAYHVSTIGDVVDSTNTTTAKLLNDHITTRIVNVGDKHMWEMSVRVYDGSYADGRVNTPLMLAAGKLMGFSAAYIDNDGSPTRESMMGSVDTQGHKDNKGYQDASVFGSMQLVDTVGEPASSSSSVSSVNTSSSSSSSTPTTGNILVSENFDMTTDGTAPAGWTPLITNSNIANKAGGSAYAVVDSTKIHGASGKSLHVKTDGGASSPVWIMKQLPTGTTQAYIRAWMYSPIKIGGGGTVNPGNHGAFMGTLTAANNNAREQRYGLVEGTSIGAFQPSPGDTPNKLSAGDSTVFVPAATWTCVEFGLDVTNNKLYGWVNDKASFTVASLSDWKQGGVALTAADLNFIELGWRGFGSTNPGELWFDDVVVSNTRVGCN